MPYKDPNKKEGVLWRTVVNYEPGDSTTIQSGYECTLCSYIHST